MSPKGSIFTSVVLINIRNQLIRHLRFIVYSSVIGVQNIFFITIGCTKLLTGFKLMQAGQSDVRCRHFELKYF